MKTALNTTVLGIAVVATHPSFKNYKSGILDDTGCFSEEVNHAVMAVGYGTENGKGYWLVKNSFGSSWGEDGYIRIAIVDGDREPGICGVQNVAEYTTTNWAEPNLTKLSLYT